MSINTAVNIDVNVDGTQSVKQASLAYEDLGDAFAKTQRQAEELALQYGINDERTKEAIKTAGRYKQQLEQLDQAIDAHRGGQETLFRAVQGVTAGFEVATGAMALFGSESEDLNKILVKVQGAMIFSQGLKDLKEFAPAIKNLASGVTGPLISAFKSFGTVARTAIASTGIGVLVVAVGSLVAYWDQIKASLIGVSKEQSDLLDLQTETSKKAQEQLDSISGQENILRLQGKTEREILQLKVAQTKSAITGLEAQLLTQKQITESQIETAKRNKEILTGILRFVQAPIYAILKSIDLVRRAVGQTSDLAESYVSGIANFIFDPEEVEKKGNETIQATEKQLLNLKNNLAGHQLAIKKIDQDAYDAKKEKDKKEAEDSKKKREEELEKEKAHKEHLLQIEKDFQSATKSEYDDTLARLDEFYKQRQLLLLQQLNNAQITQKQYDEQNEALENEHLNKIITAQKDYGQTTTQTEIDIENKKLDAKKKTVEETKRLNDIRKQSEEDVYNASQELATALVNLIGNQTKIGKGIALAQIGADTARALSGALANSNSPTPDNVATGGLAGIAKYLTLATVIATNAKRAIDIVKSGNVNKSGGSVGSISSGSVSVPSTLRSSNLNVGNEFVTADRRVYVLQGDITRTINNVNNTRAVSVVE